MSPGGDSPKGTGLIGFGPNTQSIVYTDLQNTSTGDVPLDNIFRQNLTTPNFVTFLLNRPDATNTYPGAMTISEVLPQYSNLSNQPKVPASVLSSSISADQGWSIFLDKNGVIGPDGKVSYRFIHPLIAFSRFKYFLRSSADLWVAGTVPHANTTGVNSTIPYVSGSDSGMHITALLEISAQHLAHHFSLGTIKTAELEILGFTVPSQAFSAFFERMV